MTSEPIKLDMENIDPQQEVFGTIRVQSSGRAISYVPYQLSKFSLGIIAKGGLDVIEDLTLESPKGSIKLRILGVETEGVPNGGARYNLMAVEMKDDFESLYAEDNKVIKRISGLQFARFQTSPPVILNSKTFGSTTPYIFKSINASRVGMLIMSTNKRAAPFRLGTLLEFSIEPNSSWLPAPIQGIAKVVHQTTHSGKGGLRLQYYGVELKDFIGDSESHWREAVAQLEKETIERGLRAMGVKTA